MASHSAGTTYCLATGTYEVTSPIELEPEDRLIGSGRKMTHVDGSGLPETARGIFLTANGNYFANMDVFGAPTPAAKGTTYCTPYKSDCGIAFSISTGSVTIQSVDCHDNGGNCIGGGGSASVIVDDLDCWNNGNAYSMTPEFLYAACIKRAAVYEPQGNTIVRNSYIHDNPWVGVWCDYCKFGFFDIEENRIVRNGQAGIQWEMSGGWTPSDRALIENNVIRDNNYRHGELAAAIMISTANDIIVEDNRFGANAVAGINIIFTVSRDPPQPDPRGVEIRDNSMNGDAILGCSAPSIVERVFLDRGRIIGALSIALAILVVLGLALRWRRGMLIALCAALASLFAVAIVVVLSLEPSVVICVNNS